MVPKNKFPRPFKIENHLLNIKHRSSSVKILASFGTKEVLFIFIFQAYRGFFINPQLSLQLLSLLVLLVQVPKSLSQVLDQSSVKIFKLQLQLQERRKQHGKVLRRRK